MLDKMLSVSPPLKGETLDSKVANSNSLRKPANAEMKSHFEKALQEKLDRQKDDLENKKQASKKDDELREEMLKASREEKKSSGGTKKKMTKSDDKTTSAVMASNESETEVPDQKIQNPAQVEVKQEKNSEMPEEAPVRANSSDLQQSQKLESVTTEALSAKLAEAELRQNLLPGADVSQLKQATELAGSNLETEFAQALDMKQMQAALNAEAASAKAPAVAEAQQQQQPSQVSDVDAELGRVVGFKPDAEAEQVGKDFMQKIKGMDAEKPVAAAAKPNAFEQGVLARLQQDQGSNSNSSADQESKPDLNKKSAEPVKELKSDLSYADLPQTAGNHGSLKAQAAPTAQQLSLEGRLEEHREANVNEIMKQANYLVKQGGGEVTVKMSPEGLGEVQLKVLLQDGKLNVEMQTQDKNVKKLIEDSLTELKSGLAAHRLSLEHVKIDTVAATNTDNSAQLRSNLNHGGSQGQAKEMWNEFQNNRNNQSQHRSSGASTSDQHGSSVKTSATQAINTASALRSYGRTGATINRVA